MTAERTYDLTVIGVGNLLWADGGTLGLWLLDTFATTKDLLIFDCADLKAAPGTLKVLRDGDFAVWSSTKISPHQAGVNDVLTAAALLGKAPERVTVIGVQPQVLQDYGGSLSEVVKAQLGPAMQAAEIELARWGYTLQRRPEGSHVTPLVDTSLAQDVYESGRPSEEEACREGDPRFATPQ